jgi:phage terminase Nu1 subunit (DNA packaging protein)
VDKWVREGCPVRTRGRKGIEWAFYLPDVIEWFAKRKADAAGGDAKATEEELKRRKLEAETGKAELEFAKARGEVAPVREFERATAKLMAAIRANVMNVPARAVLQLLGETDETTFKQTLRAELTLALEQSAQIDFDLDDDDEEGQDEAE